MVRRVAAGIARTSSFPTAVRAVFGYYAKTGEFDVGSLRLKRRADSTVAELIDDAFADVEEAIAEEFGYGYVSFDYDTKLVLPAKLTLGYLYRNSDENSLDRATEMTQLAVEALLDGDMRDAINDEEYDDFVVDFETTAGDRAVIAEIAQEVLQARVEEQFTNYPDAVREHYDWAVEISEAHQDEDEEFRSLMGGARAGDDDALSAIESRYKHGRFETRPELFTDAELALPYVKTQYDRVGIIYDAMIDMYRTVGFDIPDSFQRSIVLAIIGAQIWLDDMDDVDTDFADGQLTPVTAEYLLADSAHDARSAIVEASEAYLDRARMQATVADSALTGIAIEYIHRDGNPEQLPTTVPE